MTAAFFLSNLRFLRSLPQRFFVKWSPCPSEVQIIKGDCDTCRWHRRNRFSFSIPVPTCYLTLEQDTWFTCTYYIAYSYTVRATQIQGLCCRSPPFTFWFL